MTFHPPPRLAWAMAAGLVLAVVGCSQVTPLGPDPAAAMPQPHHLRSPLTLEDMHVQPSEIDGDCAAGWTALASGPGQCFRKSGPAVTTTSAGVSAVSSFRPPTVQGQPTGPVQYGFWITLPAADVPAVKAVFPLPPTPPASPGSQPSTSAVPANAPVPAISVAGHTWVLRGFGALFKDRAVQVFLSSQAQADQAQHLLAASG